MPSLSRRLLGLDVGEKRIGVAVSEGSIAVPLTIVLHENRASDIGRIAGIARDEQVSAIVVGLPISMSGDELEQARRTRTFGDALADAVDVPVEYHDERLSTRQVSRTPARRRDRPRDASRMHPARRRGKPRVDDLAAATVLQSYLDAADARP